MMFIYLLLIIIVAISAIVVSKIILLMKFNMQLQEEINKKDKKLNHVKSTNE
jgi:cell division protein FtsL